MTDKKVVKEGEPNPEDPTPQEEQDPNVEQEDVKPEGTDEYEKEKENLRNIRKAIQQEKERLSELQTTPEEPVQDDAYNRFLVTEKRALLSEAKAEVLLRSQNDPTFPARAELVMEYVKKGYSIDDADDKALAFFVKKDLMGNVQEQVRDKLNQLPKSATPEEKWKPSAEDQAELDMFDAMNKSFGK